MQPSGGWTHSPHEICIECASARCPLTNEMLTMRGVCIFSSHMTRFDLGVPANLSSRF